MSYRFLDSIWIALPYQFCYSFHDVICKMTRSIISSKDFFFNSHSHIVITFHPMLDNSLWLLLSRSTFLKIFGCQYSRFVDGHTNLGQSCLCQKQPLTKITVLYLGRTMSGHPGSFFTFLRYRNPFEKRYFRTISSGFEFVLRMWDMFMLRTSWLWLSAKLFTFW